FIRNLDLRCPAGVRSLTGADLPTTVCFTVRVFVLAVKLRDRGLALTSYAVMHEHQEIVCEVNLLHPRDLELVFQKKIPQSLHLLSWPRARSYTVTLNAPKNSDYVVLVC